MPERPIIRRARALRQAANAPEQVAWQALRRLRAYGFPVRRQHPVETYIVDFAVVKARLVIEIDGGIHNEAAVARRDAERQRVIEAAGWRVLRLSAETAMDGDAVFAEVAAALGL